MAETNSLEQLASNLQESWLQGEWNNLFRDEKPGWSMFGKYLYDTFRNYAGGNASKWFKKANGSSTNDPSTMTVKSNKSINNRDFTMSLSNNPDIAAVGYGNTRLNMAKTRNFVDQYSNFMKDTKTWASQMSNPNYISQNAPKLDLSQGPRFYLQTSSNTTVPSTPQISNNLSTNYTSQLGLANSPSYQQDFSNFGKETIDNMKSVLGENSGSTTAKQSGLSAGMQQGISSATGALVTSGVGMGLNAGLSKALGNSTGGQLASNTVSTFGSTITGNAAQTMAGNVASGTNIGANVGSNIAGMLSNAGSLTSLGSAVGNIALDVFDKRKKAKWESGVNLGLSALSFVPGMNIAAPILQLAFNGIGHAFGGSIEKGFKTDRDILAKATTYGGSIKNSLQAEGLSGQKYTLWANHDRHKDENKYYDGRRQYDAMAQIVKNNEDRQNIASGNLSIKQTEDDYNAAGGYYQQGVMVGKEGMVIEEVSKPTSIKSYTRIRLTSPTEEFKEGGTLPTVTRIKLAKEGDVLAEETSTEPEENPVEYARRRFPILNTLPEVNLQYDPKFTPREIGNFGDLEYMQAKYDTLPYYNHYPKNEQFRGQSTIVYNDNIGNEDIALDWLSHGLREYDPKWREYLERLSQDEVWGRMIDEEMFSIFMQDKQISPEQFRRMSEPSKNKIRDEYKYFLNNPNTRELYDSILDGMVRALLVSPDHRETYGGDQWESIYGQLRQSPVWKEAEKHIFGNIESFQKGGSVNVIPEGALHARLHHMENADNITKKGIPVIVEKEGGEIEQQAEVERQEIIFRLEVTKKLEELAKDGSDEAAIEAGKLLVQEILYNTIDNTNSLI